MTSKRTSARSRSGSREDLNLDGFPDQEVVPIVHSSLNGGWVLVLRKQAGINIEVDFWSETRLRIVIAA